MKEHKVGRNSPCPCGSGKKFKKCCMNAENNVNVKRDHFIPRNITFDFGVPLLDQNFYDLNSLNELSAQRLVYSNLIEPEVERIAFQFSSQMIMRGMDEEQQIKNVTSAGELIQLMNSNLDTKNQYPFKEKALEYKESFIPLLLEELETPKDDVFIELAIRIIHGSGQNLSNEVIHIISTYLNTAYQISQFCVLLGFYPSEESEQILWDYFHYFKVHYPEQTYKDGPILGLIEIREQKKEKFLDRFQAKT